MAFAPDAPAIEAPITEFEIESEVLAENLSIPWAIAFLPDGELLFTERGGKIKRLSGGIVYEVSGVAHLGEGGLQGLAVDPNFSANGFVFVYYTTQKGASLVNRVSRFVLENDSLRNETVILDDVPGNVFHDGGRIKFGPDGLLYAATGDAGRAELAQDPNSLAGKILRLNPDGSVPEDNPFSNFAWSIGHRNVQGFDWSPVSGELVATEHGPSAHDEVNVIVRGGNYGWPKKECNKGEATEGFLEAVVCFDSWTMAPSGAAFVSDPKGPWTNAFVYGGLRGEQVRVMRLDNRGRVSDERVLDGLGRIREVVAGPDGWLYLATNNTDGRGSIGPNDDKIVRFRPKRKL